MTAALYVPDSTAAAMLGQKIDWFRANVDMLERQYGFPKVDPAVGKRHKESIETWARKRNMPASLSPAPKPEEDFNAF